MRWFIVLLLLANVILFFWVQQQSRPVPGTGSLPPPEVGRLRLMTEVGDPEAERVHPLDAGARQDDVSGPMPEAPPQPAVPAPAPAVIEAPEALASDEPVTPLPVTESAAELESALPVGPEPSQAPAEDVLPPSVPFAEPAGSAAVTEAAAVALPPPAVPAEVSTDAPAGPAATAPDADIVSPACARVGPFLPRDADRLIAGLPANIQLISDTSEEYARVDGYYVLIPALPSRAEGIRKLKELEDAGITDIWLFRGGDLNNAISLGLYRSEEGARQHAARVAKKGFVCEVRERTSLKERRWLQLRNTQGGDPHGGLPLPEGVEAIPKTCP